jgi:Fur family ferric uptake transcriptional regulator
VVIHPVSNTCSNESSGPSQLRTLEPFKKILLSTGVTSPAQHEHDLREAGLRVTQQRVAVLEAVRHLPHADTDSLISAVRARTGEISHQAVYDVLKALTRAGLVRKIQPLGTVARYESRVGDNHHHVVCRTCGAIADVDCALGDTPCLTASDAGGFVIDEAEVIYWGTCPDCTSAPPLH